MAEANSDQLQILTVNEKLKQVEMWVEQVFGGESIPAFEVNTRTIELLYGLMLRNTSRNRDTQLVIEDLRQKSDEYTAEAQRLNTVLSGVNLAPSSLSQSGVMSLRTLANVALLLQTKDASDTSFLLAMEHLQCDLDSVEDSRHDEQQSLNELVVKTRSVLHQNTTLHQALQSLGEQKATQDKQMMKNAKEIRFLHAKARDYKSNIEKHQAKLMNVGADPSLYHQTLVDQSESLQALRKKIAPLKCKLQVYNDLPPNIPEAKVKIEEVRRQVAALETELMQRIDLMHDV